MLILFYRMMNLFFVLCGSLAQSSISAFLSIILSFPLMHMAHYYSRRIRLLLCAVFFMFAIMPGTVAALSISSFFSVHGIAAVIMAHLLLNIPSAFHLLYEDFVRVSSTLHLMASSLGAHSIRSYYDGILMPLLPSLVRTFVTVFILCFSSTSIPLLLGNSVWGHTLDSFMVSLHQANQTHMVMLCMILRLIVRVLLLYYGRKLVNRYRVLYKISPFYDSSDTMVHTGWIMSGCGITLCLLFPVLSVCVRSLYAVPYSVLQECLGQSLLLIVIKSFVIAVLSSSVAVGCALFFVYQQPNRAYLIGAVPWVLGGTSCAAICALVVQYVPLLLHVMVVGCHALLCIPFIMCILTNALHQYNHTWNLYAHACGATRWHIFVTLQLPYLKEAIWRSWSLSLGLSLAQVGVAQVLVDSVGMTLPVAIRLLKARGCLDGAIMLSMCSMALVCIPMICMYGYRCVWNLENNGTARVSLLVRRVRMALRRNRMQRVT